MGHKPMYCDNDDGDYCKLTNRVVRYFTLYLELGVLASVGKRSLRLNNSKSIATLDAKSGTFWK